MKECECGCGELIHGISTEGKPARFKATHNTRIAGNKTPHWKGGRIYNTQKYVLIYCPEHPFCTRDGYIREHRLVMEKYLGRYLEPKEQVHHKNGNKQDNRIENLELLSSNIEHHKLHYKEKCIDALGRFVKTGKYNTKGNG